MLNALLSTTERVVQQVDSVEYGLTDIQEYYANVGGAWRLAMSLHVLRRDGQSGLPCPARCTLQPVLDVWCEVASCCCPALSVN